VDRSIETTLQIAWELFGLLPEGELKRIKEEYIEKYRALIMTGE
jgi:V/A-type H+-transporting ATPase subunit B